MEQHFCQSCGMPLINEILGTNADGTKNEEYCSYCYKDGAFTDDLTMEEMVESCASSWMSTTRTPAKTSPRRS